MRTTRRQFLKASAAAGALASIGAVSPRWWLGPAFASTTPEQALRELMLRDSAFAKEPAKKPLRILVLGGTAFLGPAFVYLARARGHEIVLYNRGRTNAHLFEDLEQLHGDRTETHAPLAGQRFDVVLDNSGYVPRVVREAAETVRENAGRYVLVSSVSVYASFAEPNIGEDAPVAQLEDPAVEQVTGETYGGLKALCEQAAEAAMPGRTTVIRPGLIVGPMDRTDRFTYWPVRVARGGDVLAPGSADQDISFVDVRDLAEFILRGIEAEDTGTYNVTSELGRFTMGGLLDTCKKVSGSDARFVWAPASFLEEQEVAAWSEMPVWVPAEGEYAGFAAVDVRRAMAKGLRFRPLDQTVSSTLDWWKTQPESEDGPRTELRAGISAEKEAKVLEALAAHGAGGE